MLGLALGLLWLVFKDQDLKEVFNKIQDANFSWIALSLIFAFLAFVSRGYRWNMLLEPLGYRASLHNSYHSMMVGYLANLLVPRIGEVTRAGFLSRREKIPFEAVFGTVIVERIIDLLLLVLAIAFVLIFQMDTLGGFFVENVFQPMRSKFEMLLKNPLAIAGVVVVIAGIVAIFRFSPKKNDQSLLMRLRKMLRGIGSGIVTVAGMKRPFAFIFHTLFI